MTRILPIAVLLLAVGCGQQDQPPPPGANDAAGQSATPAARAPVPSLKGQWRIATVSGKPVTGLAVSVSDGQANLSAGCLRRSWTYEQDRNTVAFSPSPGGSSDCGRSPSLQEDVAFGALGDANLAIFDKEGREVTLSGFGGTLVLERR